jgi:pantothenate synthetase
MTYPNTPVKPSKATTYEDRRRTSRNLRRVLYDLFMPVEVMEVEQGLRNRNLGQSKGNQRLDWSTVRIRTEIDIALTLLQRRYVNNKDQALSRSDLIGLAVMEAMPALVAKTAA